jgi:hypothetical protein
MSCPEVSSAFATLALSPVPTERPYSHLLAFSSTASASPIHASRTHSWLPGAAHVAEPTCKSGPTLPLSNWPSDADCPTLHDFSATPVAKKRALPRLRRPAPKLQSAISIHTQTARSVLRRVSACLGRPHTWQRHPVCCLPCAESCPQLHSSAHHCQRLPSSLLIENAPEHTPQPQHPAPRHFRSRLTTIRPDDEGRLLTGTCSTAVLDVWESGCAKLSSSGETSC